MAFTAPEVEISSNKGEPSDIRNITGTVALPSGAATAARQDTGNTTLDAINTKTPPLASGRVPVDGSGVTQPISAVALPLPSGASTFAEQSSQSTKLDAVNTKLDNLLSRIPATLSNGNFKSEIFIPNNYSRGIFGGLRVVTTQNVFESLFSFDKQPNVWDEVVTAGGSATYNSNTHSVDMTVNTAAGASVVRQTFRRVRYNPSRACQFIAAAVMGQPKLNVRKRLGQFDFLDGIYFEQDDLVNYVCRRTSTSGTANDVRTPQNLWNIDKLDGSGPSGLTIDFSKHQALFAQYAFQGFATITYGFFLNGQIIFCHKEDTANILSNPFMRTAHLPCRVEITNKAATASPTTLSYNSFCVKNEGEDAESEGQVRSYSQAIKTVSTAVTPVISVRLGPGYERAIADILTTTIYVNTADEVIWSVWSQPTLTGSTFAINASYTQLDTAATAMTGGIELISGVLGQSTSSAQVSSDLLKLVNSLLGVSIAGTSQIITLAARSRIGSADVLASLVWREYP